MRYRWLALVALTVGTVMGALTASAASATDPVDLEPGYVTDVVGVLTANEKQAAEDRLLELSTQSDASLFVVFVDEFTSPSDRIQWTDTVAQNNNLGDEQYLLAVAVEQGAYYISAGAGGPIGDGQLDAIEQKIQPLLSQGDWDGAIILAADEMQGDGGAGLLRGVLIVAGIVVAALLVWLVTRIVIRARRDAEIRRRGAMPAKPDPNDPFSTLTDDQVESRAGSAIVEADDAITSSREELGFAVAQFGEGITAQFSAALEAAKAKMGEVFDLKQKLDDAVEDTVHDRRAWHIRIIGLCEDIGEMLDQNTEAFDELRGLAANAPAELERVRGERAALQPLLDGAQPALQSLMESYDAAALSTIADNPSQANERAALADRSIDAAAAAIGVDNTGEAAFAIRTAEQSVAQAAQLVQAITSLAEELAGIEKQAHELIDELQRDIAASGELPDPACTVAAAAAAATRQLQQAQTDLSSSARNPQRMLDALTTADTQIDAAIAESQESVRRAQRAQQMLEQTITQANSEIRAARDFIETRRGVVGPTARTRLSQAQEALSQAIGLASTNQSEARSAADRARQLAAQATASARADIEAADPNRYNETWGGGWGGGPFGSSSGGGSGLAGDILGGIIGGLLSGGGSSRSSGRSSWRSSGGFRSSGFGGGGRSSGRSGRSGGGRF
ncbi:TPM domain-containing protein [Microbacterium sp.]|uniref:TPM domain-containing protein n=1 Tax=Microbacterium sp. TaxID=51671 RepID=UPI002811374E|nr:TPM domain-containing protein [Microbacterium sp.]